MLSGPSKSQWQGPERYFIIAINKNSTKIKIKSRIISEKNVLRQVTTKNI